MMGGRGRGIVWSCRYGIFIHLFNEFGRLTLLTEDHVVLAFIPVYDGLVQGGLGGITWCHTSGLIRALIAL